MTNPLPSIVVIFLRGGCDGLSLVSPTGDANYVAQRPLAMRVTRDGEHKGHALHDASADVGFNFHGEARELAELFSANELAVFHAAGLKDATRSHFDAEARMERAAPGASAGTGGWLGRWLNEARPESILPSLAVGSSAPDSLRGALGIAVAGELNHLRLAPGNSMSKALREHLGLTLARDHILATPLQRLLSLSEVIEARAALDKEGNLKPYLPDVEYPQNNPLADQLKTIAQAFKLDLGLRVATVDYGGWDTHQNQAWELQRQIRTLSQAVMAFWRDLGNWRDTVSVVIMSEFGRRLKANQSGGTDHGHGNVMFALGAKVQGGRMYGAWPGLENHALDEGADLAITTDYRTILSELVVKHLAFAASKKIFPDFAEKPLGFLST